MPTDRPNKLAFAKAEIDVLAFQAEEGTFTEINGATVFITTEESVCQKRQVRIMPNERNGVL